MTEAARGRRLFVGCYAASGAAALIYQVAWTRLFTLELGHTVAASSTVLAAFMGGLALGAWAAGRRPPRPSHRLRAYASLEVAIAVLAIAVPFALLVFRPVLAWAYVDGSDPLRFAVVRVGLSLALLGVPAAVMGATFPIAAAWLADAIHSRKAGTDARPAADVAVAYAANTAGAAGGAIAAGFWLIPAFGLRVTTGIGIALNILAACGALWIPRRESPSGNHESPSDNDESPSGIHEIHDKKFRESRGRAAKRRFRGLARTRESARTPVQVATPFPLLAEAVAALSGFCALVYEVAWTRLLAVVIGPTTYAFATMAAVFISGIAMGSAIGGRLARRVASPASWLAATLFLTAVSASLAAWFAATRLPPLLAYRLASSPGESVLLLEVLAVAALLLPTGMSLGACFTLAVATAATEGASTSRVTARVYVANTLGAVAGALLAGFVLIPRLALQGTFIGISRLGATGAIAAIGIILSRRRSVGRFGRVAVPAACAVAIALIALAPVAEWDRMLLASGAYKYAGGMGVDELDTRLRAGTLEYYREGAAATVSVRRSAGTRSLAVDGKVDASNAADMLTQRLLGVLPILMHREPRELLVIGLGSGVTVDAALASGEVTRADVVEISPEVVDASRFFERENNKALDAPGVRVIVGDGRSHLLLTTRRYDVIVSEPSNPWMAGVTALFTREFFVAARERLRPGGLLCQWAHTYEMSASDLRSIVATFASVFPQGTLWLVGEGDLLLIGTTGADIESRLAAINDRWRLGRIPDVLSELGMPSSTPPFVLLSQYAGGPEQLAAFGRGATLQSDDRMALEFTAARAMFAPSSNDNVKTIRSLTPEDRLPAVVSSIVNAGNASAWSARGTTELRAEAYAMAYESFRRAVMLDPANADALHGATEAAARARQLHEARTWLEALAAEYPANAGVRVELAHVLASSGEAEGALAAAIEAGKLAPAAPQPIEQLASILEDLGDGARLAPVADQLATRFPDRESSGYYHAAALFLRGRPAEAVNAARAIVAANPKHAKAQNLLGVACAADGRMDCARAAFEASLGLSPRDPASYLNLGLFHLQTTQPAVAAGYFAEALALDASSTQAREGLAQARALAAR